MAVEEPRILNSQLFPGYKEPCFDEMMLGGRLLKDLKIEDNRRSWFRCYPEKTYRLTIKMMAAI